MTLDAGLLVQRLKTWRTFAGLSALLLFGFDLYFVLHGVQNSATDIGFLVLEYSILVWLIQYAPNSRYFYQLNLLVIFCLNIFFFRMFLNSGGIMSPIIYVVPLFPILALFYCGLRCGGAFSVSNLLVLLVLKNYNLESGIHADAAAHWSGVFVFSVSILLFLLGRALEKLRHNTVLKMEGIQKKVEANHKHLLEVESLKIKRAMLVSFNHEINNPLTTALMSTRLALRKNDYYKYSDYHLRLIENADHALRDITRSLQILNQTDLLNKEDVEEKTESGVAS